MPKMRIQFTGMSDVVKMCWNHTAVYEDTVAFCSLEVIQSYIKVLCLEFHKISKNTRYPIIKILLKNISWRQKIQNNIINFWFSYNTKWSTLCNYSLVEMHHLSVIGLVRQKKLYTKIMTSLGRYRSSKHFYWSNIHVQCIKKCVALPNAHSIK